MSEDIGIGAKVALDISEFGSSISKITQGMGLVQAQFREASSRLGEYASSNDKLAVKQNALTDKIELQRQKVALLQDAYDKAANGENKDSEQANIFAKSLLNAQTALNKMNSDLEKTTKELNDQPSKLSKVSESTKSIGEKLSSGIGAVKDAASNLFLALSGGAGLFSFAESAVNTGNRVYELGQKLGISSEDAEGLDKVLNISNTDSTAFSSTMLTLDKNVDKAASTMAKSAPSAEKLKAANDGVALAQEKLNEAEKKYPAGSTQVLSAQKALATAQASLEKVQSGGSVTINATAQALQKYGVTLTDTNGKLLPMNQQLANLSAAYQKAAESGNEDAFVADVLGSRGKQLVGVLADYNDVAAQASKTKTIGIDPEMAHKVSMEMGALKEQTEELGMTAANAAMPIVNQIIPKVQSGFSSLVSEIRSHQGEVKSLISGVATAIEDVISAVGPKAEGLLEFVATHGTIAKVALIGIAGAIGLVKITTAASNIVQAVNNALMVTGALKTGGMAAAQAVLSGATGSTTLATVALSAATVGGAIAHGAHTVATIAHTVATNALTAAQNLLTAAFLASPFGWIVLGVAAVTAVFIVLWTHCKGFRDFWIAAGNDIKSAAEWAGNGIRNAFEGAGRGLESVWNGIPGFFSGIWNAIRSGFAELNPMQWGSDLINGLVSGINSGIDDIKNAASNVANSIKSFLHFSVPDEGPLADFDKTPGDMIDLISSGLENGVGKLRAAAQKAAQAISAGMGMTASAQAVSMTTVHSVTNNNTRAPVVHIDHAHFESKGTAAASLQQLQFASQI